MGFYRRARKKLNERVEGWWEPLTDGRHYDLGTEIEIESVKVKTEKAVLVVAYGDEVWLPLSQVEFIDPELGIAYISEWIAEEKGFY